VDKKEAIRKAAIKIMAKEGFYNTKMQAIADECGIAIGTLYLYFISKEDILDYIFMVEYKCDKGRVNPFEKGTCSRRCRFYEVYDKADTQ